MKEIDIVEFSKIALSGNETDIRLYLAKAARKMRDDDPKTSKKLEELLKERSSFSNEVLRKSFSENSYTNPTSSNADSDIPLLKTNVDQYSYSTNPVFSEGLNEQLRIIIEERKHSNLLSEHGLRACSSVIFQGPPGVGKTMAANWLAQEIKLPFYTLDLTAVMSSYLGQTGSNLRKVIDFAKSHPCVLLLDEIDAIAKRRSDDADVGELKRLVTVMLQELENWPSSGLLVAATNHAELVDPAIWRRFDMSLEFERPTPDKIEEALVGFLASDYKHFKKYISLFKVIMENNSYSDIKSQVQKYRKIRVLSQKNYIVVLEKYLTDQVSGLPQAKRIDIAVKLVVESKMTQVKASAITRISRDTLRKRIKGNLERI